MKKSLFILATAFCLEASTLLAGNETKIHNPDGSITITATSNSGSSFMAVSPGAALNFDGSNDYVNIGNAISVTTGYTKEAWIYAVRCQSALIANNVPRLGSRAIRSTNPLYRKTLS